jgi:hypothetical protein
MALLFLGSWFATLHDAPKRNHAKLNALAWHILGERPKTLLGLAIKACAEKWLRQRLWMVDFDFLSPSEQHACVVIEIATRLGHGQAAEAKAPLQFTSHPHRAGTARLSGSSRSPKGIAVTSAIAR